MQPYHKLSGGLIQQQQVVLMMMLLLLLHGWTWHDDGESVNGDNDDVDVFQ